MSAWIVMAVLLVRREYLPAGLLLGPGSAAADTGVVEQWNGIYLSGEKVGYGWLRRTSEGDTLFRVKSSELMRITVLGNTQVINSRSELTLNPDFSLRSFYVAINSDDGASSLTALDRPASATGTSFEIQGGVDGNRMRMVTRQGGELEGREQTIQLDGPVYMDVGPEMLLASEGIAEGRTLRVRTFNPSTMSVSTAQIRVAGRDTVDVHGLRIPAWRIESELFGLTLTAWVDESGQELKAEAPLGISILAETKQQALEEGWSEESELDLVNLASIPAGVMRIEGARGIDSLTVRLSGIELGDFDLTFGRQELIEELVEIKKEDLSQGSDYEMPNTDRVMRRWLGSSAFVQADDRRIVRQMRSLRRGERSARAFAEQLVHWVYGDLEKVPTAGVPNAVEVLSRGAGDCNEHTVLYTALARAAGIPTQMNAGVVYMDGRFYYHAWPSVWLGQWVAVDPTFDQFPADATHIGFVRGDLDRQVALTQVIGRVSIDVVSYAPMPDGGRDR